MLAIGIDASRLRSGMTGAGRYAAGLLASLNDAMPDARFVLYARRDYDVKLPSERWQVRIDRHPLWSRLPTTLWIHFRLANLVNRDNPAVFWATNTLTPRGLKYSVRCVTSVLDFNHILVPETLPPVTRFAHRRWMDADVKRAAMNVAISQGTAIRMYSLLGRQADAVAYPAVPPMPPPPDAQMAQQNLINLGVKRPFLLTVGTRAPRKNLASAVAAVELLRASGLLLDYQLVMVGQEAWDRSGRSIERTKDRAWLNALGFVSDAALATLYANADALVFPSLYEGFGMPVIEARAYGCRVVTTNSPELREAGGDEAIYSDTTPESIAAGIRAALTRPRPERGQVGYSWKQAAEVMARVFQAAASS